MADNAPAVKTPKKKAAAKPKKPADHPKYSEMVASAVSALKERGGSSRQAILKYILKNYNVGKDERKVNSRVKLALRAGVTNGALKQSKGTGASGSFRLGEVKAKKAKKAKPAAKKAKSPKKAKTPKKEKKTPKKASKPKGEKKAAKPKKAKSPAKKSPAKKAVKAAKPKKVSKPAAKKSPAKKTAKAAKPKVKKAAAKKK